MRAWHFSETAYPFLPPADTYPSIRVSLPNRLYDPIKGAALYDRFIDEWLIAEDEGRLTPQQGQAAPGLDAPLPLLPETFGALVEESFMLLEPPCGWEWVSDLPSAVRAGRTYHVTGHVLKPR